MKYLLVLLVVGIGLWLAAKRLRGPQPPGRRPADRSTAAADRRRAQTMVECAHCGLHLPAADALAEGSRLYCCDAHRRLGPAAPPPA